MNKKLFLLAFLATSAMVQGAALPRGGRNTEVKVYLPGPHPGEQFGSKLVVFVKMPPLYYEFKENVSRAVAALRNGARLAGVEVAPGLNYPEDFDIANGGQRMDEESYQDARRLFSSSIPDLNGLCVTMNVSRRFGEEEGKR